MDSKTHWETIYSTKAPTEMSWYQANPQLSMQIIEHTGIAHDDPIVDVGGGASLLVDYLLNAGFKDITVMDISAHALDSAREHLGTRAVKVHWKEADVTQTELPREHFALWHDRAVFHFLTDRTAQKRYIDLVRHAVKPGGHVIVATFANDGPSECSGLEVVRYDSASLLDTFGNDFVLVESARESHETPWQSEQKFMYCYCRKS